MYYQKIISILLLVSCFHLSHSQSNNQQFKWPKTPASKVMQDFVVAYNSGNSKKLEDFFLKHFPYGESSTEQLNADTEEWMDMYHRHGPIKAHSISINKPYDIEVWMECTISKNWFAPEFIINKETNKVRATALLEGEQPKGVINRSKNDDDFLNRIKEYLYENEKANLFQGVVLIQKNQEVVFQEAYGKKDIAKNIDNTLDTRMRISSITKHITAMACLQLVQNGYLELDKPLSNYISELPKNIANKLTVKKLVLHTSGYELDDIPEFRNDLQKTKSIEETFKVHLKFLPKWEKYKDFNPKGNFDYSNDSYDLLALLIERISGLKFEEYLDKYIFKVANMKHTSFSIDDVATPYRYDLPKKGVVDYSNHYPFAIGEISGTGGLKTTVSDLRNLFNTLYYTNKLLNLPQKNMMFSMLTQTNSVINPEIGETPLKGFENPNNIKQRVKNGKSMGFTISYDVNLSIGHNGTSIGNSAELRFFPDTGYLIIALCNNRSGAQNFFRFFNNNMPKK